MAAVARGRSFGLKSGAAPFGERHYSDTLLTSCCQERYHRVSFMRRADRLFQIIQILRRRAAVTRASDLAEELEVSVRTVYRDVADLIGSGVPIEGEAGVGYLLRDGYDLPPLMFTVDEIEALALGASIVASWSDPELARAAEDVRAKIGSVLPERRKIRLDYADEAGDRSERIVRPLALAFYGPVWVMVAWCELRNDFRNFRLDRMAEAEILETRFAPEPGKRLADFVAIMKRCEESYSRRPLDARRPALAAGARPQSP